MIPGPKRAPGRTRRRRNEEAEQIAGPRPEEARRPQKKTTRRAQKAPEEAGTRKPEDERPEEAQEGRRDMMTRKTAGDEMQFIDDVLIDCERGIISASDIQTTIEEFLDTLRNPDDIYSNKPMIFNGLLEYIYKRNVKRILPNTYNNDYELLDDIFRNIYLYLCYMFNYVPNISTFCNHLCHIDMNNIYNIKTGFNIIDGSKVNINSMRICKNWDSICNGDLFGHIAQTGSVGGIFVAKVKGFSDQPQPGPAVTVNLAPGIEEKQLARLAAAIVPELPETT